MLEKHRDYYLEEYFELAKQRESHLEDIKESLFSESTDDFIFKDWCRVVKWRYSNHPLCTLGSIRESGGRFNMGNMSPNLIPQFSALYIAKDKETAESEGLLSKISSKNSNEMSTYDLSLSTKDSFSSIFISGKLDFIFDIRGYKKLTRITKILKKFKFSKTLKEKSKKLKLKPKLRILQNRKEIHQSIMNKNWIRHTKDFDLPSNSQIFGQLVRSSGISGIVYRSCYTGRDCLAIFPSNFKNSSSFIQIQGKPPHSQTPKKIDKSNFDLFEKEIIV